MPARLGEILLRAGTLNEAQLEQVLSAQAVCGGMLGTNLVDMGFLREEELARLPDEKTGVPALEPSALDAIPGDVLAVIPRDMVQRYQVLPVALEGKRLTLALADPTDLQALEDIGFVTGLTVVPRVCSELRLRLALERYFGISRSLRNVPAAKEPEALPAGKPGATAATAAERLSGGFGPGSAGAKLTPRGLTAASAPESGRPGASDGKGVGVKGLAEALAVASGESEVVSALLAYLAEEFDRGAFLGLRREGHSGLQAVGVTSCPGGFAGGAISLQDARQLKRVVQERCIFIGELPSTGGDGQLMKGIGGREREPALLLPITVAGQVVAILCASDLQGRLAAGVFELQRVAAMAELALEMLCIRKRIRSG